MINRRGMIVLLLIALLSALALATVASDVQAFGGDGMRWDVSVPRRARVVVVVVDALTASYSRNRATANTIGLTS